MEIFKLLEIKGIPERGFETETEISRGKGWRVIRTVSNAASSPEGFWYDQKEDETVFVLAGWGEIEFEPETVTLRAGDGVFIPKGRRHRVKGTSEPCVWLCVYGE
jgi:cupin 2 domain-containing protein